MKQPQHFINKMTKKLLSSEIKRLPLIFPIEVKTFAEREDGQIPSEIHVLPTGKWNHPYYGPIVITREDISEFKRNFDKGLRKDIPITEGHEVMDEKPAIAWFKELSDRGENGLYATIEWTETGKQLLRDKSYKYFSPEFYSEYEDPQTREIHENVLVGGALTNKPYFKELDAVVMSEKIISKFSETNMNLEEILKKSVEELSQDEKAFLAENKDELSTDDLAKFGSVFEDGEVEEKEEKEDGEVEEETTPTEAGDEGGATEPVNASEFKTDANGNVLMSLSEAKLLAERANAGHLALEKMRMSEIKNECEKLVFSETNKAGKFLPKSEKQLFSFMKGLTEKQRKAFSELMETVKTKQMFNESGSDKGVNASVAKQVDAKVQKVMSENKVGYAEAVKKVFKENPELAKSYEAEIAGK